LTILSQYSTSQWELVQPEWCDLRSGSWIGPNELVHESVVGYGEGIPRC